MENVLRNNFSDNLYSFTKIQGAIKTWTFQGIAEDGRKIYRSNYGEVYHLSPFEIENNYFEKEEDCFVAWVEALEKKKQQIIKRFEKKFNKKYSIYSTRLLLEEYPEIKERIKKVAESFKP